MIWRHIDSWRDAAAELGISISGPIEVAVESGAFAADLLVHEFGARRGMIIVTDYAVVEPHEWALIQEGYGFSSFPPPVNGISLSTEDAIDFLRDWSWSGPPDAMPAWLSEGRHSSP